MPIFDELLQGETALLQPEVRRSREALEELLAQDFREFGSSGRAYTRKEEIEGLLAETSREIRIVDFAVVELAPGVAMATYCSVHEASSALRSSLWVQRDGRWQMLFHQGTKVAT